MSSRRATRQCCTCDFTGVLSQRGQCEPCAEAGKRIIVNELLCYTNHSLDRSSVQAIWDAIIIFCHPDEIKAAKTLLWGVYTDILPETHDGRDSYVRAAHEKETSEIIDAMLKISELTDDEQFQFAALNLTRIPNHAPEEINIAFVLQRLIEIEKKKTYYGESCREKYGTYFDPVWY